MVVAREMVLQAVGKKYSKIKRLVTWVTDSDTELTLVFLHQNLVLKVAKDVPVTGCY